MLIAVSYLSRFQLKQSISEPCFFTLCFSEPTFKLKISLSTERFPLCIFSSMYVEKEITIKTEKRKDWFIIFLFGKFVVKNLTRIRLSFEEAEKNPNLKVAIDFSKVSQIDSSAITLLANFQKRLMEKGSSAIIYGASQDIAEILSIVGLDKVISITADIHYYDKIIQNKL